MNDSVKRRSFACNKPNADSLSNADKSDSVEHSRQLLLHLSISELRDLSQLHSDSVASFEVLLRKLSVNNLLLMLGELFLVLSLLAAVFVDVIYDDSIFSTLIIACFLLSCFFLLYSYLRHLAFSELSKGDSADIETYQRLSRGLYTHLQQKTRTLKEVMLDGEGIGDVSEPSKANTSMSDKLI